LADATAGAASFWIGVGAPKNTPVAIVDRLNKEINAALTDSKMKARFADLGGVPLPMTPAEFGKLIANETEKWGKVTGRPTSSRNDPRAPDIPYCPLRQSLTGQ
jgi:tripartite-type tricarboxylate transporter receptor subunit TctC